MCYILAEWLNRHQDRSKRYKTHLMSLWCLCLAFLRLLRGLGSLGCLGHERGRNIHLAVILGIVTKSFDNTPHVLNLEILNIDDFVTKGSQYTVWFVLVRYIITCEFFCMKESFAHVNCILVMRDHLVKEQCSSTSLVHICSHARCHRAIHRVEASCELPHNPIRLIADKLLGTLWMRKLKITKTICSTSLIICTWHIILIGNCWGIYRA
mmetsp:Transcript_21680/g.32959  ORF Transcript_21680/g.32959 Transcript_21680/m.32959 type:complete len:210 (-) Transcript_21680:754-1383(-)